MAIPVKPRLSLQQIERYIAQLSPLEQGMGMFGLERVFLDALRDLQDQNVAAAEVGNRGTLI